MATNMKKIQEDQAFTIEWIKRVQAQTDMHEELLDQIQIKLKMA